MQACSVIRTNYSDICQCWRGPAEANSDFGRTEYLADEAEMWLILLIRLFDIKSDPAQTTTLDDPVSEQQMIDKMLRVMKENDAPEEQYERLGLTIPGT